MDSGRAEAGGGARDAEACIGRDGSGGCSEKKLEIQDNVKKDVAMGEGGLQNEAVVLKDALGEEGGGAQQKRARSAVPRRSGKMYS